MPRAMRFGGEPPGIPTATEAPQVMSMSAIPNRAAARSGVGAT